jgi:isopentenyl-diphosphate delta-isomerase
MALIGRQARRDGPTRREKRNPGAAMTAIPAWINGHLVAVDKLRVHRAGLRHMAVSVFVVAEDQVLLQRRALTKYHTPGLWTNTCCTHPHWGETPRDCALRRLREELGITGLDPVLRGRIEYRAGVGGGMTEHEVVDLFLARPTVGLEVVPNPDEVAEVRWIEMDALRRDVAARPDRYTPWLRVYLAEHEGTIFGTGPES